jgi:hypothetical protein
MITIRSLIFNYLRESYQENGIKTFTAVDFNETLPKYGRYLGIMHIAEVYVREWRLIRQKRFFDKEMEEINNLYPRVSSEFGHGVFTINPPWVLRTPPGINLMTMNPPNYVLPNVTCMTGTIETDNIRRNFTFNMKIQIPNIRVRFPAGTPLAAFIPIPRYFPDKFELKIAEDIFDKDVMEEEYRVMAQIDDYRNTVEPTKPYGVGRLYFRGLDGDGNKFKDHQFPRN